MSQIIYSESALGDLERIAEYLLAVDLASAPAVMNDLTAAVQMLSSHPLIGRRVVGEIRELVVSRGRTGYLALYRFDAAFDAVRILRLRHQAEAGYRE